MKVRLFGLFLGCVALLCPLTADAYIATLYFRNLTTGDRNTLVMAHPGDKISINFDFSTAFSERWKELSVYLDLNGSSILNTTNATGILDYVETFLPSAYTLFTYGPALVCDDSSNPANTARPLLTTSGIYFKINIDPAKTQAGIGLTRITEFTIPLTAKAGEKLQWGRLNQNDPISVSTRVVDKFNVRNLLQFNELQIVPEPSLAPLLFGGLGFVALARRRR